MRLPLIDLKRTVAEQAGLRGSHIDNIYQVGPKVLLFKLKPGPIFLLADLTPGKARLLVTDQPPEVPQKPPMFASILRRTLRGGRLLDSIMLGEDRIFRLDIEAAGSLFRVVLEALPRHPNLLLLDFEGTVLRVMDGAAAKHRDNPVGSTYRAPEPPGFGDDKSLLPDDLPPTPFAANPHLDRLMRAEASAQAEETDEKARQKTVARIQRALNGVEGDLRKLADPAKLRADGQFLLTHFSALTKGMAKYRGVALESKLSPVENVDRIFERARKAQRAQPALERRRAELEELKRRAEAGDFVPERQIPGRKGVPQRPRRPYRVFLSADGDRILVGKGGRDNDETTLKIAGPNDLFLHVRGTPGAHVIVPLGKGEQIREQTLLDAGHLALHYSRMRNATAADVSYTPRRNVSKGKGTKPGLVTVRQEKVLRVRREAERIARLLMSMDPPPMTAP